MHSPWPTESAAAAGDVVPHPITVLNLPAKAQRALRTEGITTIDGLEPGGYDGPGALEALPYVGATRARTAWDAYGSHRDLPLDAGGGPGGVNYGLDSLAEAATAARGLMTDRDWEILCRRDSGDTLEQIGADLGCTRERVRQISKKASDNLARFTAIAAAAAELTDRLTRPTSVRVAARAVAGIDPCDDDDVAVIVRAVVAEQTLTGGSRTLPRTTLPGGVETISLTRSGARIAATLEKRAVTAADAGELGPVRGVATVEALADFVDADLAIDPDETEAVVAAIADGDSFADLAVVWARMGADPATVKVPEIAAVYTADPGGGPNGAGTGGDADASKGAPRVLLTWPYAAISKVESILRAHGGGISAAALALAIDDRRDRALNHLSAYKDTLFVRLQDNTYAHIDNVDSGDLRLHRPMDEVLMEVLDELSPTGAQVSRKRVIAEVCRRQRRASANNVAAAIQQQGDVVEGDLAGTIRRRRSDEPYLVGRPHDNVALWCEIDGPYRGCWSMVTYVDPFSYGPGSILTSSFDLPMSLVPYLACDYAVPFEVAVNDGLRLTGHWTSTTISLFTSSRLLPGTIGFKKLLVDHLGLAEAGWVRITITGERAAHVECTDSPDGANAEDTLCNLVRADRGRLVRDGSDLHNWVRAVGFDGILDEDLDIDDVVTAIRNRVRRSSKQHRSGIVRPHKNAARFVAATLPEHFPDLFDDVEADPEEGGEDDGV